MSAKPRVSVVIPVHNREGAISRAVDSVLTQSWHDLELIVVDDGSTDATMAIVESVSDTRLRLLRHDRNRGAAAARNTGIEAAAGAYVAFLDSDDCWFPDKLEIQIAAMEEAPPKIAATCTGYVTHRLGSGRRTFRIPDAPEGWFKAILDVCKVHPSTLIVRLHAIECVGLQDPSLKCFEDWEWLLRFLERYELRCVPDILAEIYVGARRSPALVDEAAERLFHASRERVLRRSGKTGCRRFRASLFLEGAVARWAAGLPFGAALFVLRAALHSPSRVLSLLRRIVRKIADRDY